jgi:hypothetical protein
MGGVGRVEVGRGDVSGHRVLIRWIWVWEGCLDELLGVLVEGLRVIRHVLEVSVSEKTRGLGLGLVCVAQSRCVDP